MNYNNYNKGGKMDWDYLNYDEISGFLRYDNNDLYIDKRFKSLEDAENYLLDNDLRASIR
jgi:hypothetical protein